MATGSDHVRYDVTDGVATLTLDRPERKNAVSTSMRDAVRDRLRAFDADGDARVLVLTGVADSFCAGMDLDDWEPRGEAGLFPDATADRPIEELDLGDEIRERPHEIFRFDHFRLPRDLYEVRKPTVAAVNGYAMGLGICLVAACDVRIAASDATFGLPEIRHGGIPGDESLPLLLRRIDTGALATMLLTGEPVDADEARDAGVVWEVHPPERLGERAAALASSIADRDPAAVRLAKKAVIDVESAGMDAEVEGVNTLIKALALVESGRADGADDNV